MWYFTSTASSNKSQIIKFSNLIFHHRSTVPQFRTVVLVVSCSDGNHCAIANIAQSNDLKRRGQGLVGPPVGRERGAQELRAAGAHQLVWVFGLSFADDVLGPPDIRMPVTDSWFRHGRFLARPTVLSHAARRQRYWKMHLVYTRIHDYRRNLRICINYFFKT